MLSVDKANFFTIANSYNYKDFFKELVVANKEGKQLIVNCQVDPSPELIGVLKQLSEDDIFSLSHFQNKKNFREKLNPKTRLIFCIKSIDLEIKITYPFFINLFGSIIKI